MKNNFNNVNSSINAQAGIKTTYKNLSGCQLSKVRMNDKN